VRPFDTIGMPAPARCAGTDFVVGWTAAEPVADTSILGGSGSQGYSSVGQGRPARIVGEQR